MEINTTGFALVLLAMGALAWPMGHWLAKAFQDGHHWALERLSYRALGVDPAERMGWARYGLALLLSNAAMMALGYLVLRLQGWLPLNDLGNPAQTPDLAFNTAASFISNTNWQAYAGESSLSNATQMLAITFLMFCGATAGVAAAGGFIRALARASSQ
ncbi:MAG: potassium-transporting ATPase subunit KdpA, partial [Comamonadaceae bacterium]|nr:potassium-transporting ATPase subunit KdpA [Comamonadaceae bacterium]